MNLYLIILDILNRKNLINEVPEIFSSKKIFHGKLTPKRNSRKSHKRVLSNFLERNTY